MQAEHSPFRGNGFIITPNKAPSVAPDFSAYKYVPRHKKFSDIKQAFQYAFGKCCCYTKKKTRIFMRALLSFGVAVCCCLVFFNFFTFGTGIYCSGKQIATISTEKDFYTALSVAQSVAHTYQTTVNAENFNIAPVITLRTNITDSSALCDALLLSSPDFTLAYTLYCGNTEIFSAESKEIAQDVVKKYISSYSMNGDAQLSQKLSYRQGVIPQKKLSTKEECAQLLKDSDVAVVSVVNTSTQEAVPFETQTQPDSNLYIGESITVSEGKAGTAQIAHEIVYENGMEQTKRVINHDIISPPVTRLVRVGTKEKEVLKSGLYYPLKGVISSPFGERWGKMHEGLDIAVPEGTIVCAAECGTVSYVNENAGGYGKFIRIDHGYGVTTAYAHLSEIEVTTGQKVGQGERIALSGNTGRSTGPHLHFEVVQNGVPLDPTLYLKN